jgi:hypothetical protein
VLEEKSFYLEDLYHIWCEVSQDARFRPIFGLGKNMSSKSHPPFSLLAQPTLGVSGWSRLELSRPKTGGWQLSFVNKGPMTGMTGEFVIIALLHACMNESIHFASRVALFLCFEIVKLSDTPLNPMHHTPYHPHLLSNNHHALYQRAFQTSGSG